MEKLIIILEILLSFIILCALCYGKIHYKNERHLQNVRQLTFGGQNAEGYFR